MIEKDTISIIALADLLKSRGIITEDELAEYLDKWRQQARDMDDADNLDDYAKDLYLFELLA